MGQQKSEAELFNYAVNLEKRVRSTHPLRKVKAAIDFSFVREEVVYNGNIIFSAWNGWDLVEEYKPSNVLDASYLHGAESDELISMTRSGQTYYYYQDGRGNTSQLTNQSSGQQIESYTYDLNGTPSTTSTVGNRFLFSGREYYQEVGLYNYRNRFYSPELGRFLQPDPIGFAGDPANLYRYCGNNPANLSDPMGTNVEWIGEFPPHMVVGITDPTSGTRMSYFQFFPKSNPFFGPGIWSFSTGRPSGATLHTTYTSPEQDAQIVAAFKEKVANQGDYDSVEGNDCIQAPTRVVMDVIGGPIYKFFRSIGQFFSKLFGGANSNPNTNGTTSDSDTKGDADGIVVKGAPVADPRNGFTWGGGPGGLGPGAGWGGGGDGVGYGAFGGVSGVNGIPGSDDITGSLIGDAVAHSRSDH